MKTRLLPIWWKMALLQVSVVVYYYNYSELFTLFEAIISIICLISSLSCNFQLAQTQWPSMQHICRHISVECHAHTYVQEGLIMGCYWWDMVLVPMHPFGWRRSHFGSLKIPGERTGEKMDTTRFAGDEISVGWTPWFQLWLLFIQLLSRMLNSWHKLSVCYLFFFFTVKH